MNRNQLDEMQQQKKNKIGNQTYMLLTYLLLIDIALHGFGVKWLQYPTNVFILILAANAFYLVRTIMNNAVMGPGITAKRTGIKSAVIMLISGIAAFISASIILKNNSQPQPVENDAFGAYILFGFSSLIIIITIIVSIVSYIRNRNNRE